VAKNLPEKNDGEKNEKKGEKTPGKNNEKTASHDSDKIHVEAGKEPCQYKISVPESFATKKVTVTVNVDGKPISGSPMVLDVDSVM